MAYEGHLSATARVLGFAGLVPQLFAVLLIVSGADAALGTLAAFGYASLILCFLGGIWWGFAMRAGQVQSWITLAAVSPMLLAFLCLLLRLFGASAGMVLAAIGVMLMLTLLVDRKLTTAGLTPPGWMHLRVPLSLGLGALTIVAAALAPHGVNLIYSN
jgi:hypothetical protein